MNLDAAIPLLLLASSLLPGLVIFTLPEESHLLRTLLNLAGAGVKLLLAGWMVWGSYHGHRYGVSLPLLPGLELALRAGSLALLFVTLSSGLWLVTTLYAVGYLEGEPHRSRFFGFFSLCVTATVGVAMAGNLLTFLLFYELLTLTTYPLVVHRGNEVARRAGQIYLVHTLFGGALLLMGAAWLYTLTGTLTFQQGGFVAHLGGTHRESLIAIFVLLIAGVGVKGVLVPLHGWLPRAMVAPAPVSALLHAVAVVKAGAFGIALIVYEVFGAPFAAQLGVTGPLAGVAAVTILYGSLRALFQDDLKRRLAFSTISQISYITLGIAIAGPYATIGGLVHLVHHGLMKITLFFCAGNLAATLGVHKVSEMNGVGRRMPWTMAAFTIAALGLIGLPPLAGFISKWYLAEGALRAHQQWVVYLLAISSLLNAAYFLPIVNAAWFRDPPSEWPAERPVGKQETSWPLLLPPIITAALSVAAGVLASLPFSPLDWAGRVAELEFRGQ